MAFSDMHVFPYSARPGTSAAHFGEQVNEGIKRERMTRMLDLAADGHHCFRQAQLGSVRRVLWEPQPSANDRSIWHGLSDNYIKVRVASRRRLANTITDARLEQIDGDTVSAVIV